MEWLALVWVFACEFELVTIEIEGFGFAIFFFGSHVPGVSSSLVAKVVGTGATGVVEVGTVEEAATGAAGAVEEVVEEAVEGAVEGTAEGTVEGEVEVTRAVEEEGVESTLEGEVLVVDWT
jgi:hypothetical protein